MSKIISKEYLTVKIAKETIVYRVVNENLNELSLHAHIMGSSEIVNILKKRFRKYHIRINGIFSPKFEYENCTHRNTVKAFELWTWGVNAENPQCLKKFKDRESAENELFRHVYNSEYLLDNSPHRDFYFTYEEAIEKEASLHAATYNLDINVSKSILSKQKKIKKALNETENKRILQLRIKATEIAIELSKSFIINENKTYGQIRREFYENFKHYIDKSLINKVSSLIWEMHINKTNN